MPDRRMSPWVAVSVIFDGSSASRQLAGEVTPAREDAG